MATITTQAPPTSKHTYKEKEKGYEKECPSCHRFNHNPNPICAKCGHVFQPKMKKKTAPKPKTLRPIRWRFYHKIGGLLNSLTHGRQNRRPPIPRFSP